MSSIQEVISRNEVELVTLVLENLPEVFVQNQIVEKSKGAQMREKERQLSIKPRRKIKIVDPEKQIEIAANGKIEVKEMAGAKSGGIAARIIGELYFHVKANKLGRLYTPDTTFVMGESQRMPDVSFVPTAKIPQDGEPAGKWKFAPDLAVEVVSPTDSMKKIRGRLNEFFAAEVKETWIVEPEVGVLSIYHEPLKPTQILTKDDTLTGSKVLPDFKLQLNEIFID